MKIVKRALITLLVLILAIPYVFLNTSVKQVKAKAKEYHCVVSKNERVKQPVVLGTVFYSYNFKLHDVRKVVPYVGFDEVVNYAQCGDKEFTLGTFDFGDTLNKVGTKIHLYTKTDQIFLFGIHLWDEEDIEMFGTD